MTLSDRLDVVVSFGIPFAVSAVLFLAIVLLLFWIGYPRSRTRFDFRNWEAQKISWDGRVAAQIRVGRKHADVVDPSKPYQVSWDHLEDTDCVYSVTQGRNTIRVSTNDPSAGFFLTSVFKVDNYPFGTSWNEYFG
jgi:hypothetical protein